MFLHLETGRCEAGIDVDDIDDWAFECPRSRDYTNEEDDETKYRCPDPDCQQSFRFVSGLLQHAETDACKTGIRGAVNQMVVYVKTQIWSQS